MFSKVVIFAICLPNMNYPKPTGLGRPWSPQVGRQNHQLGDATTAIAQYEEALRLLSDAIAFREKAWGMQGGQGLPLAAVMWNPHHMNCHTAVISC